MIKFLLYSSSNYTFIGSLSLVVYNIPVADCSSDWPLDNTAPLYTNFHPVAVHRLCASLPESDTTGQHLQKLLTSSTSTQTPHLPTTLPLPYPPPPSTSVLATQAQSSFTTEFTIPSHAAQQHTVSLPLSSQTVPIDPGPSTLDSKVQEVILATSLRYLQHDFAQPSSSLPQITSPSPHSPSPSTQSGQSSSPPHTTTTQQPEWGLPHLLLDSPTIVQSPPPPQRAQTLVDRPLSIQSCKPLNMSSPAWRRISSWITAIETFLEMQQCGYKPEPSVAQRCSREMMEAIREVEEDKGLMSYDIILVSSSSDPSWTWLQQTYLRR